MAKIISLVVLVSVVALGLILYVNQNPSAPDTSELSLNDKAENQFNNPYNNQVNQQNQQAPQQQQTQNPAPTTAGQATVATNSASAIIKTSKGDIKITLYNKEAPNTVNNFVNKSTSGFYNNLTFHRVEDWVIQGGDPKGNGTGGGDMPTEINDKPFVTGAVGIARGGNKAISNDSQFFITKSDSTWLNQEYTNFGIVTEGMDVVNKIEIGDKILGITLE